MSIVDTHEKDLSNDDRKSDMRKLNIFSVKSSSTVSSFSVRSMYNKVDRAKKTSRA